MQVDFIADGSEVGDRKRYEFEGFPVYVFDFHSSGKMHKLGEMMRFARWLKIGSGRHYDLMHLHGADYINVFLAYFFQVVTGRPSLLKVTSLGWDTPDALKKGRYGPLIDAMFKRISGVVVMSSYQRAICRGVGYRGYLKVIPNGVDCRRFRPASDGEKTAIRRELGVPQSSKVILFFGWLGRGKGTDILFDVWHTLRHEIPDLHLLCGGNFLPSLRTREQIAAFLEENHLDPKDALSPSFHFFGPDPTPERFFRAADVFMFPSRREGFGTVQIEAMASGLPCVVNDIEGVSVDIFPNEKFGFRVAGNDKARYIDILRVLLTSDDIARNIGASARGRAKKLFSLDVVSRKYIDLYTLLSGRGLSEEKKSVGIELLE